MLHRIKPNNYKLIRKHSLFQLLNEYLSLNINPILQQSFPGTIWVDNLKKPTMAYVYDNRRAHYLIGEIESNRELLSEFVHKEINSIISQSKEGSTFIYKKDWEIVDSLTKFDFLKNAVIINRGIYRFNKSEPVEVEGTIPPACKVIEVTKDLLAMDLKNIVGLISELKHMWIDIDNFFKFGFGVCAVQGDALAGWCLGEYFSEKNSSLDRKKFGIGIETYPEYQKKGIATAMTNLLIKIGLEKGYTVYWDCYKGNNASIRTALKVGFELVNDYQILYSGPNS